jgi:hypothetical protein
MIRFLVTNGHDYTLQALKRSPVAALVSYMHYDRLIRSRKLPVGTYIFSDLDRLSPSDLELAAVIFLEMKRLGVRVLNNPARVKPRYALLRALHDAGINHFNAYRMEEVGPGMRFPVFLRNTQGHGKPLSDLMHSLEETQSAIEKAVDSGIPGENLMVVEFAAEPVYPPNFYRKLSAFRVGDKFVAHNHVLQSHWLVKYGEIGLSWDALFQEELDMVRTNPHTEVLRRAFEIAGIEYGRADYGLVGGHIQIYEINTNPTLGSPSPHPNAIRVESMNLAWKNLLGALRELDSSGNGTIRIRNDRLRPYQTRTLQNILTRTRVTR